MPPLSKLVLNTVVGFDYEIKFLPLPFPVNIHSLWLPVKHLSKPILAKQITLLRNSSFAGYKELCLILPPPMVNPTHLLLIKPSCNKYYNSLLKTIPVLQKIA